MTESEAIKEIETSIELAKMCTQNFERTKEIEPYTMAIKVLEKQIPKKPKTNDNYIIYICPCCNNLIKLCKNYCEYCGQKLDWSDEE